jgi:VanZ family protein
MLLVIGIESTDLLSASHTGGIILPILLRLFPDASLHTLQSVHVILRKIGHVFGYALLSWFLFRGWWGTAAESAALPEPGPWRMRFATLGFLGASLVAISDEIHQMTIPSRGGSVHDILLDASAALATQILLFFLIQRRNAAATVRAER